MRILVHDFAGHPFQLQLSRELADRGAEVLHLCSAELDTPQGSFNRLPTDPNDLQIRGLKVNCPHKKHQLLKRFVFERRYAAELARQAAAYRPDVVISANTPSVVLSKLADWAASARVPWVNWVQDLYGLAAYKVLRKKLPVAGEVIGGYFLKLDKGSYRRAAASVVITDDFTPLLTDWGIDRTAVHTVPNWAPLAELPSRPRDNAWSHRQGLDDRVRFIYSGTLSMKHNPALLLALGEWLDESGAGELLVNSQGAAVEWLAGQARERGVSSIRCLGFQPYEELADAFGAADVLVAVLEPDASVFSVPSKVLSYFCAGRAILAAIPSENLAAKTIQTAAAGEVVDPGDPEAFVAAARRLAESLPLRQSAASSGRAYAEATFDIGQIGDRFEAILRGAAGDSPVAPQRTATGRDAFAPQPAAG
ncbi:MAG: glycosyltransferase family 4 protein [Planctomycetota bacterium]